MTISEYINRIDAFCESALAEYEISTVLNEGVGSAFAKAGHAIVAGIKKLGQLLVKLGRAIASVFTRIKNAIAVGKGVSNVAFTYNTVFLKKPNITVPKISFSKVEISRAALQKEYDKLQPYVNALRGGKEVKVKVGDKVPAALLVNISYWSKLSEEVGKQVMDMDKFLDSKGNKDSLEASLNKETRAQVNQRDMKPNAQIEQKYFSRGKNGKDSERALKNADKFIAGSDTDDFQPAGGGLIDHPGTSYSKKTNTVIAKRVLGEEEGKDYLRLQKDFCNDLLEIVRAAYTVTNKLGTQDEETLAFRKGGKETIVTRASRRAAKRNESNESAEDIAFLRAQLLIEAADALADSSDDAGEPLPSVDEYDPEEGFTIAEDEDDITVSDEYVPEVSGGDDEETYPADDDLEELEDLLDDDDDAMDIMTERDGTETIDAEPTVESILNFN